MIAALRPWLWSIALAAACASTASAQTSTGAIAGVVKDSSGAVVAGVTVAIVGDHTGLERNVVTSQDGRYAAPLLLPGTYVLTALERNLRARPISVLVQASTTETVELVLELDTIVETATVVARAGLRDDHHRVSGWIDVAKVEAVPLNGRNVFEIVKLAPGVASPARLGGGRLFIAPLGAGLNPIPRVGFTRVTVDGASIETPGTVGSLLQVSPDVVDQVHVTTANFDVSTGLATSGAVNVVTRSGGNRYRATAFSLYRDRRWSAFPADATGSAPSPTFRRYQGGTTIGGPLRSGVAFFFVGYERHDQRDLIVVRPSDPSLAPLGGSFVSPYSGSLFTGRLDLKLTDRQRLFVRHTHDVNRTVTPESATTMPSAWSHRPVRAHQTLLSLTSLVSMSVVNELRASYYGTAASIDPVTASDCAAPCVGLGAPRILLSDGGSTVLTLGRSFTSRNTGRRVQVSDVLVWQKGAHLVRTGFDLDHTAHSLASSDSDPVTLTLWTPLAAAARDPSIALPDSVTSVDEALRLPVRGFTTSVGAHQVLQRGFQDVRRFAIFRAHVADEWRIGSRLSINAGLAWAYEPGVLNDDLTRPAWLQPLVGSTPLDIPHAFRTLSGTAGIAWTATRDARTIVRAGLGRYSESIARTVALNLANERALLSPLGTSRLVVSGSNLAWNGRRLNFPQPTSFTGADLMAVLPEIRHALAASLSPENRDFSVVSLDVTKEGRNLYDPAYATPTARHVSIGIERQFDRDVTVGADFVWKRFAHTFINGIDYNRFLSSTGPVIPACSTANRSNVAVTCSNGSLYFDTTSGQARYAGLLLRADKRLSRGLHVLASYALGNFVGSNGTGTGTTETSDGRVFGFNNDDWSENDGPLPTDLRHLLNVAGLVVAPWDVNLSFNLSSSSRAPFSAYVAGMDFNGDGTVNDLLPGTRVNQFNRGLTRTDLTRLVAEYNATYAGNLTTGGQRAPFVTLPSTFEFNDNFFTLDIRVAKAFALQTSARLSVILDVFNVFNTVNLVGFSGNLAAPDSFGQPSALVGQAFGSGGPRAAQFGIRVAF